jgi:hypothetical protein
LNQFVSDSSQKVIRQRASSNSVELEQDFG